MVLAMLVALGECDMGPLHFMRNMPFIVPSCASKVSSDLYIALFTLFLCCNSWNDVFLRK